jgi:ring-1,2-phenylacetyl-CoA epoxidase subunit PaaE
MSYKEIIIKLTDQERLVHVPQDQSILGAALSEGIKLFHSCQKGMCGSCRAVLISGDVDMRNNFSLTEDEIRAGQILLCQSYPVAHGVVVDPIRKPRTSN